MCEYIEELWDENLEVVPTILGTPVNVNVNVSRHVTHTRRAYFGSSFAVFSNFEVPQHDWTNILTHTESYLVPEYWPEYCLPEYRTGYLNLNTSTNFNKQPTHLIEKHTSHSRSTIKNRLSKVDHIYCASNPSC